MAFYKFANPEIKNLFQWNKNIRVVLPCAEEGQEVHFANNKETAFVLTLDENLEVQIPNELLEEAKPLEIYTYIDDGNEGFTKQRAVIDIIARPKPTEFISEPEGFDSVDRKFDKFQGLENAGKVVVVDDEGYLTTSTLEFEGDKSYIYVQNVVSSVWNIQHNLDKYPSVTVVDTAGTVVVGDIKYKNSSTLSIRFGAPFSGKAYLN